VFIFSYTVGIASSYTAPAGLIFGDDVESLFLDLGIPPTGVCWK